MQAFRTVQNCCLHSDDARNFEIGGGPMARRCEGPESKKCHFTFTIYLNEQSRSWRPGARWLGPSNSERLCCRPPPLRSRPFFHFCERPRGTQQHFESSRHSHYVQCRKYIASAFFALSAPRCSCIVHDTPPHCAFL